MTSAASTFLETGVYTVAEAAYLIRVTERKVRGWVSGYPKTNMIPIITNELGWVNNRLAFSFTNLMEMRFIAFFERAGVHLFHIRSIMDEVKSLVEHPHPFATNFVFRTDGKKIVGEAIARKNRKIVYDLHSRNYEMWNIVYPTLKDDVIYDPEGVARGWYPRRDLAPNVILHPKVAFGQPILRKSRIPTRALSDAVKAQGNVRAVAEWFDIPETHVRESVKFETALRQAA